MTTTISYGQFDRAARKAVKTSMQLHGRSLCASTIMMNYKLMQYGAKIEMLNPDTKTMEISGDWRNALNLAAQSFSKIS